MRHSLNHIKSLIRSLNLHTTRRVSFSILSIFLFSASTFATYYLASAPREAAVSTTIVISQVYGGGGNTGATLLNDYVELFNLSSSPQSLNGLSLQYGSSSGSFGSTATNVFALPNVTLQPGQYFLFAGNSGGAVGSALPTPDGSQSGFSMSASAGKVALVNSATALNCGATAATCNAAQLALILDAVAYGTQTGSYTGEGGTQTPTLSSTLAAFRAANGCTDTDSNSANFSTGTPAPRNTASALNPCGGSGNPSVVPTCPTSLSTTFGTATSGNVSATDSNGTVTSAIITSITPSDPGTITLSSFTPAGAVGGSATATLNVSNATPANTYTVVITWSNNDSPTPQTATCSVMVTVSAPVTLTKINAIQGPGSSSPLVGQTVTTSGIVTGLKSNGFFLQEPDASVDADPATSEGIFVFTSSAPPAAAAIGNLVQVAGTISEFVPSADPQQPPLTELVSPTVTLVSSGNPLPAAIPLTATFPDPTGVFNQLERVEGMRVSVASLTVGGPTLGNVNEPNATATSTGVFFGTVTGVARAFREAGIQHPDTPPSGTIPPIPRFDTNPEVIRVDSDGLVGGAAINVSTTAVVTGLVGPLDYGFRHYTILPDPSSPLSVSGGMTATAVATALSNEVTIASYNIERFFDDVNDPAIGEPVLTTVAYQGRLTKASLHIRNYLKTPDIVGIVEIENLTTLQALATKINDDAVANSQPNPLYLAFLVEGNDVGGIDVGFLVKTAIVTGSTPRVTVNAVVQELDASLFTNADSSTEILHDRPPLRLDATVNFASGATFPVQVIINHLRSLNGVDDNSAGSSGWATVGARVRAKRLAQVVDLANLVQTRQTNNPNERIVLVGDFNFFEVNDGYGDSMSTLLGAPVPDNETVVPGDGVDLVNPNLTLLLDSLLQRYSFVFDGNAQSLDHAIINSALISATSARRVEHARVNGDFPETDRNGTLTRLADHDPLVVYLQLPSADLAITKTDGVTSATPGGSVTYTITASNAGPDPVTGATVSDTFPASLTGTWTCVGAGGGTCTAAGSGNINDTVNLPAGGSVTYTVSATISASATGSLSNTATVSSSVADPNSANNSATDSDTLTPQADLAITKTDGVTSATPGQSVTYTITASNAGPSNAPGSTVADTFPASLTGTWTCVGAGGGTCTAAGSGNINDTVNLPAGGSVTYTVTANISASATGTLSNTATVATGGGVTDPTPGNNSATDSDTLTPSANLGITKTNGVTSVTAGNSVTYTIVASNAGPSNAPGSTVADTFPATITGVNWTCVGAGGGTCPASGSGNINATVNLPAGGSVTFTASGTLSAVASGTLTNTATVATAGSVTDPTPGNNSATDSDTITGTCNITCPTNVTTWTSSNSATVSYSAPTTSGACGTTTCSPASGSTFNVGTTTVTCSTNAGPSCSFTVTVNKLTLGSVGLADPLACAGAGDKINGDFSATNTTGASATISLTATLTNLATLPGMASASLPGTVTINAASINWTGTVGAGQTVTVTWMGQLADNLLPGTQACSTITATANDLPVNGQAQACLTINCPAAGPGLAFPAASEASDQGAGSVLIYNIYTSGATSGNTQNTRVNLTNIHP
ncbi:MAG: DUF11 domain-containing protein, partial [Acidobacteria bacterium]|nr:DUF11 domain-containing protein [Acidobacteriota bacterium]